MRTSTLCSCAAPCVSFLSLFPCRNNLTHHLDCLLTHVLYTVKRGQCLEWCREVVNPAYALLARAMFQTVERLAATDLKHGDRLRLESYAYFVTALSDEGQGVPVLQWHVRQAAAAKLRAMQAYVQQQLEHGRFWKLMEFSLVTCTACYVCI